MISQRIIKDKIQPCTPPLRTPSAASFYNRILKWDGTRKTTHHWNWLRPLPPVFFSL